MPRRRGVRIGLALLMLVRGLIPSPTSPLLLSGAVSLLSMDVPRLRRWWRRIIVAAGRRRRRGDG